MRVAVDTSVRSRLFVPDDTWHSQALNYDALIALLER